MTTSILLMNMGTSSSAVSTTFYSVGNELGYFSFSCNDEGFFEYFMEGGLCEKFEWLNSDTGEPTKGVKYADTDGIEHYEAITSQAMINIITANPKAFAEVVYQRFTGHIFPGGDVTVIFPNN